MKPSIETSKSAPQLPNAWSIRPCEVYKDEYDDCTSIKGRFHQYFVHGDYTDCTQWKIDHENCKKYQVSNGFDVIAGEAVIRSEEERRTKRMQAHYGNTTWTKRSSPPENWSAPLPEWLAKRNENTYLDLKQKELEGKLPPIQEEVKKFCVIM